MEERSDYSIQPQVQLQEEEAITEGDLLQVAIQYACAKHVGDEDTYPPDARLRSVLFVRSQKALVYRML